MTNDLLLAAIARPSFDEGFTNWLATADMEDILDSYVESYKDGHGIKARWMYGAPMPTRIEFANMFDHLRHDIEASIAADKARDAAFMAMVASVGLSDWAAENNITCEMDLWEHNYQRDWVADPEAFPYDEMTRH
jgi:hypothetical protein